MNSSSLSLTVNDSEKAFSRGQKRRKYENFNEEQLNKLQNYFSKVF